MIRKTLLFISALCMATFASAAGFARAVAATVDDVLSMFRPEPLAFAGAPLGLTRITFGQPVDAATQHALRHEAGIARLAAHRNI